MFEFRGTNHRGTETQRRQKTKMSEYSGLLPFFLPSLCLCASVVRILFVAAPPSSRRLRADRGGGPLPPPSPRRAYDSGHPARPAGSPPARYCMSSIPIFRPVSAAPMPPAATVFADHADGL